MRTDLPVSMRKADWPNHVIFMRPLRCGNMVRPMGGRVKPGTDARTFALER
jgi:hypothetical protein